MYIKHCKLSRNKQSELMKYSVAGSTVRTATDLVGMHLNTSVKFCYKLRAKLALKQQNRREQFCRKTELDKSSCVAHRKRKCYVACKVAVLGILKCGKKFTCRLSWM